jgi:hypothetical protein
MSFFLLFKTIKSKIIGQFKELAARCLLLQTQIRSGGEMNKKHTIFFVALLFTLTINTCVFSVAEIIKKL